MPTRTKRADVKELLENVAPPKGLDLAEDAVAQMREAQAAFIGKANFVLDDLQTPYPITSGAPLDLVADLEKMEYAAAQVTAKVNNILAHYKTDETSKTLYVLEKDRWDLVVHFARVATNFAQDKIPHDDAVSWLTSDTKLNDLKTRHAQYSTINPKREKTITAAGDTVVERGKTTNKSTSNTGDVRQKQRELIVLTVEVAKFIATATRDSLSNYDYAVKNLKEAKTIVDEIGRKPVAPKPTKELKPDASHDSKATQVLRKKGQYVKFAGCVYKAVD